MTEHEKQTKMTVIIIDGVNTKKGKFREFNFQKHGKDNLFSETNRKERMYVLIGKIF